MSMYKGVRRHVLSGIVVFALVIGTMPVGLAGGITAPSVGGGSAPPFALLKSAGPTQAFTPTSAQSDLVNVRWRKGVSGLQIRAAGQRFGFSATKTSKIGWAQLTPKPSVTPGGLARALREARLVTEAKPSVLMKAFDADPNDPLFSSQWSLKNTGQDGGTAGADISATAAWSQTNGSHDVIVAIVDQGVNWAHPDLKNNMWINTAEVPNNGIDDDNNGYVDDVRGWDFRNGDNTVYDAADADRHGTHVAGIIGAESDNGVGIAGVNRHVRIMPLKFIGGDGYGEDYDAADAIVYAVDHGATVINCSWGGGDSELIRDAVDYAAAKGVILSVSAGNEATNNDSSEWASYPASYDATNIVSVAASDRDDKIAEWSNYGADSVDLAAPGVDVTSTMPAEAAGLYTDAYTYKCVYLPLQAEIMEPASARDALISGAVAQLGEATDTPILVVDDSAAKVTSETQGVRLKVYTDALAAAGYADVTTWVTDAKGTPTQQAMNGKVVVWFTGKDTMGWYGDPCLNFDEQHAIATCLDSGGRFVLISGKAASDLQYFGGMADDLDLISDYFGARWMGYEHWGRTFDGRSATKIAGVKVTIPVEYTTGEAPGNLWPTASDAIVRNDNGLGATAIMYTSQYAPLSGTSMAAPHVTGAIALLKAKYPSIAADELVARILNTVDSKPALAGKTASGGRLNVAAAMSSYPGRVNITSPKKGDRLHTGSASTLRWTPAVGGATGATFTAQVGVPYTALSVGFEGGILAPFEEPEGSGSPWIASTEATAVRTGSYGAESGPIPAAVPAPDMGEGWYMMGVSAMVTTITVPAGGGDLSFYWRMPESDGWDTMGAVFTDEDGRYLDSFNSDDRTAWTKETFHLSAGEHPIFFEALNSDVNPSDVKLYVDDITLTAHAFTDIGSAGAGATALDFTVPAAATDDAWFRVQSHLDGVDSAWATVKGVQLVSDAVPPAAPSGLTLTPDLDGSVNITWGNPTDPDFDHVLVLSATDHTPTARDDKDATVSYEGTGTAATFGPVKSGTPVHVSAWAVDTSGNWSPITSAHTTAVDNTAPSPVRSLRVVQPRPDFPLVLWGGTSEGDVATVLRSYTSTPIVGDPDAMSIDGESGMAIDWDVDPDASQAIYTVYLTDPSGNVSAPRSVRAVLDSGKVSGSISIESADVDPMSDSAIITSTTAWVNANVTNATQMRVSVNGEGDLDGDWVPFQSRFSVEFFPIHGQQSVSVEFRKSPDDIATVLSASALVMLRSPLTPRALSAQRWNTGVKLRWDVPADPTLASYRIEVGGTSLGPWRPVAQPLAMEMGGASMFVAGLTPGVHYFRATAVDVLGGAGVPSQVVTGTVGSGTRRFSGVGRTGTAVIASSSRFSLPTTESPGSDTVVIAPDSDYIQALAANSLAGRYSASVLVAGSSLSAGTEQEIHRLGVHKALVVGTQAALSTAVDARLKQLGLRVERISGADRYAVAANVARRMSTSVVGSRDALVVRAGSTADMCSLMPIAYNSGRPVVIVNKLSVPAATKALLAKTPFDSVTIVGGTGAISSNVYRQFSAKAPTVRVWGTTAADTAARLATWAVANDLASWDEVNIVNPAAWAMSLNAGAAGGGGVVLLTAGTKLPSGTASALRKNARKIRTASVFGGLGSVSNPVKANVRSALLIPVTGPIADPNSMIDPPNPTGGGE